MQTSILIPSYGQPHWQHLATTRAEPAARRCEPFEVLTEHFPDGDINTSRNALAAKATGDWLCFLDADDELEPDYLREMQAAYCGRKKLYTPAVRIVRRRRSKPPDFYPQVDLRYGNWLIIGTLIERRTFLALGGFRDWPHGLEDWDLWARAHYAGLEVVRVPGAIYVQHRDGPSSHARAARTPGYRPAYDAILASHKELP